MEVTPTQLIALLREGTAPLKVRAAVARGTLPLSPPALLESLDILADDPDEAVQAEALRSMERLPATVVRGVVSTRALDPGLLGRLARRYRQNEGVLLEIARNAACDDAGVAYLASLPFPAVLEVIGRNQVRLERSPETVAALFANPATPTEIVQLWQEHVDRSAPAPAAAGFPEEVAEEQHVFAPVLVEEDEGEAAAAAPAPAAVAAAAAVEADGALSAKQLSIYAMLKRMSMGQKVALATKGNREVRNLLIRENNKMLCLKVLENPRLGEGDIEAYAKSTNISIDVLRGIANNKDWMKKYNIARGLIFNPRAPLGLTLDHVKRLTDKDLEFLAKNRNVPETLRNTARRMISAKKEKKQQ
jgi:hypothetical protein